MNCKICKNTAVPFGESTILGRYKASYFRCRACGFVQVSDPVWLEQAYSNAISKLDTGIMQRNVTNTDITCATIRLFAPKAKLFLDFGGGHGTLVRMMRDQGFDFRWSDSFAENIHARGFEHREGAHYDFLTSFEVLEHLCDPLNEISTMMSLADDVFVSTLVLPDPPPQPGDWWYYTLASGQHVSFYTHASLELIARKFNRYLLSNGFFHLFSSERRSNRMFSLATMPLTAKLIRIAARRPSLTQRDHDSFATIQ